MSYEQKLSQEQLFLSWSPRVVLKTLSCIILLNKGESIFIKKNLHIILNDTN